VLSIKTFKYIQPNVKNEDKKYRMIDVNCLHFVKRFHSKNAIPDVRYFNSAIIHENYIIDYQIPENKNHHGDRRIVVTTIATITNTLWGGHFE
jgi:DNA-binding MltR family transcriptional regulator